MVTCIGWIGFVLLTASGPVTAESTLEESSLAIILLETDVLSAEEALLAAGLADDIRDALSGAGGLSVTGLSSPTYLENRYLAPGATRDPLGVAVLLRMTMAQRDETPRVGLSLMSTEDGALLWGETYDISDGGLREARRGILENVVGIFGLSTASLGHSGTIEGAEYRDYLMARGLLRRQDRESIERGHRLLQSLSSDFIPARLALADSALRLHREHDALTLDAALEEANAAITAVLRINPLSSVAYRIKGDIARLRPWDDEGDDESFQVARSVYRRAIDLDPDNGAALLALGNLLFGRRAFAEAAPLLERATRADPTNLATRMLAARATRASGRVDDARRQYLKLLAIDPGHEPALVALGYLERQVGRLDASAAWFERGAAAPGGWYNNVRLAVTFTDLGDLDRMRRAIEAIQGSPHAEALGEALRLLFESRFEAVISFAEDQLDRDEENEALWRSFAGSAAIVVGELDSGLDHYRIAYPGPFENPPDVNRRNVTESIWVAFALREKGESARAKRIAEGALSVLAPPAHGYEWVHTKPYRMAVHAILGRVDEALRDFRAAIDQGWRSILYGRFVRFEETPMLRELHTRPEFQAMIDEIKQYNALMLADVDAADQRRAHRK